MDNLNSIHLTNKIDIQLSENDSIILVRQETEWHEVDGPK